MHYNMYKLLKYTVILIKYVVNALADTCIIAKYYSDTQF